MKKQQKSEIVGGFKSKLYTLTTVYHSTEPKTTLKRPPPSSQFRLPEIEQSHQLFSNIWNKYQLIHCRLTLDSSISPQFMATVW